MGTKKHLQHPAAAAAAAAAMEKHLQHPAAATKKHLQKLLLRYAPRWSTRPQKKTMVVQKSGETRVLFTSVYKVLQRASVASSFSQTNVKSSAPLTLGLVKVSPLKMASQAKLRTA